MRLALAATENKKKYKKETITKDKEKNLSRIQELSLRCIMYEKSGFC